MSFKLADMAMELKAAELLTLEAAWKFDQKTVTDMDMAMAKLKATEMLAFVADEAIQIHGGMGLMSRPAARAHLARRPRRAHLGRHQRDPAPHHLARAAAAARRLIACAARASPACSIAKSIAFVGGGRMRRRDQPHDASLGFRRQDLAVHPKRAELGGVA